MGLDDRDTGQADGNYYIILGCIYIYVLVGNQGTLVYRYYIGVAFPYSLLGTRKSRVYGHTLQNQSGCFGLRIQGI